MFFCAFLVSCFLHLVITMGVGFQPTLEAWHNEPRATEWLIVTDDTGRGAARFHAIARDGKLNWGEASATQVVGSGEGVGTFAYGEMTPDSTGTAWGANPIAATYSATGNAVGMEVNGVNRSGSPLPTVYGLHVVNGGNAPTIAGVTIETSPTEPAGVPQYGLWIKSESTVGANDTGVYVEEVTTGEAFRTVDGQRIALSTDGLTYLRYNATDNRLELYKAGILVAQW